MNTAAIHAAPNGIPTGISWEKAATLMETEEGRKKLKRSIDAYFRDLRKARVRSGEKTTRPGHNEIPQRQEVDVRVYGPYVDTDLLTLSRYVDKTGSRNPTHKYISVSGGQITFREKQPGEKAPIQPIKTGPVETLKSVTHHGGLGIDDDDARFDDYGVFEQAVQTVPSVYNNRIARMHADILGALGSGQNQSWDSDLIKTLNNAMAAILDDIGDDYGLEDNVEFALAFNHHQSEKVLQALASAWTIPNDNQSKRALVFNVRPVKSRLLSQGELYVGVPGLDFVDAEWDPLFSEHGRDPDMGEDRWIWRGRRNIGLGNQKQFRRIEPA